LRLLLVVDDLVDRGRATAAPLLRPGEAGIAGLGLLRLPLLGALAELGVFGAGAIDHRRARLLALGILVEEGGSAGAEFGFLRGVFKVHDVPPPLTSGRCWFRDG